MKAHSVKIWESTKISMLYEQVSHDILGKEGCTNAWERKLFTYQR
jgi:hypothetical protein